MLARNFKTSTDSARYESVGVMCENREPTDDINAVREELAALLRLSHEKLEEMKQIQARIDEMTAEIAMLTEEMENERG